MSITYFVIRWHVVRAIILNPLQRSESNYLSLLLLQGKNDKNNILIVCAQLQLTSDDYQRDYEFSSWTCSSFDRRSGFVFPYYRLSVRLIADRGKIIPIFRAGRAAARPIHSFSAILVWSTPIGTYTIITSPLGSAHTSVDIGWVRMFLTTNRNQSARWANVSTWPLHVLSGYSVVPVCVLRSLNIFCLSVVTGEMLHIFFLVPVLLKFCLVASGGIQLKRRLILNYTQLSLHRIYWFLLPNRWRCSVAFVDISCRRFVHCRVKRTTSSCPPTVTIMKNWWFCHQTPWTWGQQGGITTTTITIITTTTRRSMYGTACSTLCFIRPPWGMPEYSQDLWGGL